MRGDAFECKSGSGSVSWRELRQNSDLPYPATSKGRGAPEQRTIRALCVARRGRRRMAESHRRVRAYRTFGRAPTRGQSTRGDAVVQSRNETISASGKDGPGGRYAPAASALARAGRKTSCRPWRNPHQAPKPGCGVRPDPERPPFGGQARSVRSWRVQRRNRRYRAAENRWHLAVWNCRRSNNSSSDRRRTAQALANRMYTSKA